MKLAYCFLSLLGTLALGWIVLPDTSASALSGSEFRAGNIIEDSIFFDGDSMSVNQIQDFLNSKVPSCDTWGGQIYSGSQTRAQYGASRGSPAPYTCLRNYTENTPSRAAESSLCGNYSGGQKSSAQIIYDVAMTCGVSPKVLIILLQKEQTLITDDWPWPIQYRSATGYGCPDTAACDSEYYGFFNQVYNAARIYKKYARDSNQYGHRAGRYNDIRYNPVASCSTKSVFIENQATAGLYVYTPYTPNPAALNNLYGSGDSCSAYGNRNFWRMYNDWFGSTYGSLVRTTSSGELFYTDGTNKIGVGSMEMVAEYGLGLGDVRFISQQEMDSLRLGQDGYSTLLSYLVKSNSDGDIDGGSIYIISRGRSFRISSMEQFNNYGFQISDIHYIPLGLIQRMIPADAGLTNYLQAPSGAVYGVENGKIRAIPELSTFLSVSQGAEVSPMSNFILGRFAFGTPIIENDAIISTPNGAIKLYQEGVTYTIPSMEVYNCWGFSGIKKITFPSFEYIGTSATSASTLGCIVKNGATQFFLLDANKKYQLASGTTGVPSTVLGRTIDRLPTAKTNVSVIRKSNGAVSVLEADKKRPIPNMEAFFDLGLTDTDITNIANDAFDSIDTGQIMFSLGAPLVEADGRVSVITETNKRLTVNSINQFINFGLQTRTLYPVDQAQIAPISSNGTLPDVFSNGGSPAFADNGKLYKLDTSELQTAYGFSTSGLAILPQQSIKQLLPAPATRFVRSITNSQVYYLENGQKRPFTSWQQVVNMGGGDKITFFTDYSMSKFTLGSQMQ